MALKDILTTTKPRKEMDADSIKEHILNNSKTYKELIAY
jgi:hypothetical protein